jgi:polysaccharide export outer membrane protein
VVGRRRTAAQLAAAICIAALAACSSVAAVNDRAMLVGPEPTAPEPRPDPTRLLRRTQTEYRVGPRDLLEVEIYELEEPNKSKQLRTRVSQDGNIVVPLLGQVGAGGKTAREIQDAIARMLGEDFLVNPTVNVLVVEHEARRVTVLGAVASPGTFALKDNSTTLIDALAMAGGPTEKAGSSVYVVHGAPVPAAEGAGAVPAAADRDDAAAEPAADPGHNIVKIDLTDLIERGDMSANCVLEDGDVVQVPPVAQFFVMGEVRQGGAFPLRGEITLLRAIALAGGLKQEATPSATVLIRSTEQGRITIPIDLAEVGAGSEKDVRMQADDVVVVNQSSAAQFVRGVGTFLRDLFSINYGL